MKYLLQNNLSMFICPNVHSDQYSLSQSTPSEIIDVIDSMKSKKRSMGIDKISAVMLKEIKHEIAYPLCTLINTVKPGN